MAKAYRLQNSVQRYKLNKPITLEFSSREFELFHSITHGLEQERWRHISENFSNITRLREICLNMDFQVYTYFETKIPITIQQH
jgi:hypothetical protein